MCIYLYSFNADFNGNFNRTECRLKFPSIRDAKNIVIKKITEEN